MTRQSNLFGIPEKVMTKTGEEKMFKLLIGNE